MTAALAPEGQRWSDFVAPRYWGTWLLILWLRALAFLPFKLGLSMGNGIGMLLYYLLKHRRHVTLVNTQLCFPEKDDSERSAFVKSIFRANGTGLVETAWAYWGNKDTIQKRTTLKGGELLTAALKQGRGVILLGAHFSTLDLGGVLISFFGHPVECLYRKHDNPLMDHIIRSKRSRFTSVIERKKIRQVVRSLRKNHCVWYAPDQDFGKANAVFVPFFGQLAATIVGTTKMVRLNNSPILMVSHHRNADASGYTIELTTVPGFPSGDDKQDALIVNQTIEREIRKAPDQYMWVHRRFKTQPDGRNKLYEKAAKE
jgi:KDO2-lipid IV(A) lauroyltransferase